MFAVRRTRRSAAALSCAHLLVLLLAPTVCGGRAAADTVLLPATRDNTIYSESYHLSNGAGEYFFAGVTLMGNFRRGLIAFDVASVVPAGSTITDVTLQLHMSRTVAGNQTVSLHRVLTDWGEGTADAPGEEGGGAAATDGDATWAYTFYETIDPPAAPAWTTTGGDYAPAASATESVDINGFYTWGSTAQMVADVQLWLDNPASDFGWIVMGNEVQQPTAKRFDTHENVEVTFQPVLTVSYEPPPCPADMDGDNAVAVPDLLTLLAAWGTNPGGPPDLDGDGTVAVPDLLQLLASWGPCP